MLSVLVMNARHNADVAGISCATLGKLVGVSASTITGVFREAQKLSSEKEAELFTITSRLVRYQQALFPLPLPRDVEMLKVLLDANIPFEDVEKAVGAIFGRGGAAF